MIIGSVALKHWFPDFYRDPKDLDIISTKKRISKEIEYHWVGAFQYILDNNKDKTYVDPDFLYTIKVGHAAWDVHWDKTMFDIRFLQSKGCKLDYTLYKQLIKAWEKIHRKKRIKLKGSPEEFFHNRVSRRIPHDEVHELVKFYDRPLHERIRKDLNDVSVSKELWEKLSEEDKLKCALEEIYVFALERYSEKYSPKAAFNKALKHLITLSTKGYFNLFLIENFFKLLYYNKDGYFEFYKKYKELIK